MEIKKIKDLFMKYSFFGIAGFNIIIVFLVFFFVFINSMKFFINYPIKDFLMGKEWISLSEKFGLLPLIIGSFWVTLVALGIMVPLSLIISIYTAEYAKPKTEKIIKIIIEIMSAIPSVALGYIGLYALSTPIKEIFELSTGLTAFTGGILLSFMSIPRAVTVSYNSIRTLDISYKEASMALGANKLETIVKVILPAASPRIFAGIMMGFGRIVGETMTVVMVTGNASILNTGPFSPVRTLTATIATEMGEVVQGSLHYYALFAVALVLFSISFTRNMITDYFTNRYRKKMGEII